MNERVNSTYILNRIRTVRVISSSCRDLTGTYSTLNRVTSLTSSILVKIHDLGKTEVKSEHKLYCTLTRGGVLLSESRS